MKHVFIVLSIISFLISCKTEPKKNIYAVAKNTNDSTKGINTNQQPINLPIGIKKLIEYNFPKAWNNLESIDDQNPDFRIDKISKKGYDSISYFIGRYYGDFYYSLKLDRKKKLNFIPKISKVIDQDKTNYFKIDTAYYAGTILKNNNYTLEIYKDGGKYDKLKGHENSAVVNYLTLVSFDLNKNLKDSLTIYYYDHALYAYDNTFFYIDKNLNIILKDFAADEIETHSLGIRKYKIDSSGNFEEIEADSPQKNDSNSSNDDETNLWKGRYYFEARNKDDFKTSFDISIENLKNITIKYIGDGNSLEVYKNLKGEELSPNKIRIVFNEKYEDMGVINLEKDGDDYSISGQTIYFINPGNDNYPIKKVKL